MQNIIWYLSVMISKGEAEHYYYNIKINIKICHNTYFNSNMNSINITFYSYD